MAIVRTGFMRTSGVTLYWEIDDATNKVVAITADNKNTTQEITVQLLKDDVVVWQGVLPQGVNTYPIPEGDQPYYTDLGDQYANYGINLFPSGTL